MTMILDESGKEAAWRRLRNCLSKSGMPESNCDYQIMAQKVIEAYIRNKRQAARYEILNVPQQTEGKDDE